MERSGLVTRENEVLRLTDRGLIYRIPFGRAVEAHVMDSAQWNPWHGCKKISPGCLNCYVYRMDAKYGRDSSVVQKTGNFRLPVMKDRRGEYKLKSGEER